LVGNHPWKLCRSSGRGSQRGSCHARGPRSHGRTIRETRSRAPILQQSPDPECHGRTPRSIIDLERARLPMVVSGQEAMHDPDCPCCQMAADMPGPMFWHLDGSAMDDDFAFDMTHRTRAEWEEEQRKWDEHRRRFKTARRAS